MGHPVPSQEMQAAFWQRHIAILASFACMHVDELAFAIDLVDLQADPFQQAQPAGIDGRETNPIALPVDAPQHTSNFSHTQDDWQLFLFGGTQKLEGLPLPPQRSLKKELDPAQCQGAGGPGSLFFILEEQEILA